MAEVRSPNIGSEIIIRDRGSSIKTKDVITKSKEATKRWSKGSNKKLIRKANLPRGARNSLVRLLLKNAIITGREVTDEQIDSATRLMMIANNPSMRDEINDPNLENAFNLLDPSFRRDFGERVLGTSTQARETKKRLRGIKEKERLADLRKKERIETKKANKLREAKRVEAERLRVERVEAKKAKDLKEADILEVEKAERRLKAERLKLEITRERIKRKATKRRIDESIRKIELTKKILEDKEAIVLRKEAEFKQLKDRLKKQLISNGVPSRIASQAVSGVSTNPNTPIGAIGKPSKKDLDKIPEKIPERVVKPVPPPDRGNAGVIWDIGRKFGLPAAVLTGVISSIYKPFRLIEAQPPQAQPPQEVLRGDIEEGQEPEDLDPERDLEAQQEPTDPSRQPSRQPTKIPSDPPSGPSSSPSGPSGPSGPPSGPSGPSGPPSGPSRQPTRIPSAGPRGLRRWFPAIMAGLASEAKDRYESTNELTITADVAMQHLADGFKKNPESERYAALRDSFTDLLPELHIPGYKYAGPGTNVFSRLADTKNSLPLNELDTLAMEHDLAYTTGDREFMQKADNKMLKDLEAMYTPGDIDTATVYWFMRFKTTLDQTFGWELPGGLTGIPGKVASDTEKKRITNVVDNFKDFLIDSGITLKPNNAGYNTPPVQDDKGKESLATLKQSINELVKEDEGIKKVIFGETKNIPPDIDPLSQSTMSASSKVKRKERSPMLHVPRTELQGLVDAFAKTGAKAEADDLFQFFSKRSEFGNTKADDRLREEVAKYSEISDPTVAIGHLLNNIVPKFRRAELNFMVDDSIRKLKSIKEDIQRRVSREAEEASATPPPFEEALLAPTEEEQKASAEDVPAGDVGEAEAVEEAKVPEDVGEAEAEAEAKVPEAVGGEELKVAEDVPPLAGATASLFTERVAPVARAGQIVRADKDKLDAQNFQKFRPDFRTIDEKEVEEEITKIDSDGIRQETIDFSYVPVSGWRSVDNSIYGMGAVNKNIQFSEPFLNHTDIGIVQAKGKAPMVVPVDDGTPPVDPKLEQLQKPMFLQSSLQWDIPMMPTTQPLNIGTVKMMPVTASQENSFLVPWMFNKNINPFPKNVPFVTFDPPRTDLPEDQIPEKIPPSEMINSSVGLGLMNFDGAFGT